MNKILYWLSARPLFWLIGKGYAALRKVLDNIPGFDAYHKLATGVTDRVFGLIKAPAAVEDRFEPYMEFSRGRQMDRAITFAVLVYMALLGLYPSRLGHLDTAPQIWLALPIVSGFNPYLGLVSGIVFSVFDWIGKWLPFENVFGADYGGNVQDFFGARIGYILAYTTMILNGLLPGVLARVFRQFIRGVAHKIVPRKAGQVAMGLLMLLATGWLLYQVAGPQAIVAMSALSLMGFAMAMGPPPPGQGSSCMQCGAALPPGVHQCGCGGISHEARDVIDKKRQAEEDLQRRRAHEERMRQQAAPGGGPAPPPGGPGGPPPPFPDPGMAAGAAASGDYLYEAMATIGSMLGATVGIVASQEWAQQVGNYGAFYMLRANADVGCANLSEGNYNGLQARAPIPGAVGGAMPPGAAGAMTGGPDPGVMPDPNPPAAQTSRWIKDDQGRVVPQIYDPSVGGWRTARHGDVDADGDVFDANFPGGASFVSQGLSAAEAAQRADNARWQQEQWDKVRTGDTAHDRALRDMQERHRQSQELHQRRIEGNYSFKKFMYDTNQSILLGQAEMHNKAADRWDRRMKQAKVVKAGADIMMNGLGAIPGPGTAISKAYTVVSSGASGAAEAHASGQNVIYGGLKGSAQGAVTVIVQDAMGGAISGGASGFAKGQGALGRLGGALKGAGSGAAGEVGKTLNGVRTGYNAIRGGVRSATSAASSGARTASTAIREGGEAVGDVVGGAVQRGARGASQAGAHGATAAGQAGAFGRGTGRALRQGQSQIQGGINRAVTGTGQGLSQAGRGAGEALSQTGQNLRNAMGPTGPVKPGDVINGIFTGDRASAITSGNPTATPDIATQDCQDGMKYIAEDMRAALQ